MSLSSSDAFYGRPGLYFILTGFVGGTFEAGFWVSSGAYLAIVSEYFCQNNWLSNGVPGWTKKCAGGGGMSARGDTFGLLFGFTEFGSIIV